MSRKQPELAYPESIADLWGYPEAKYPKRPSTATLFRAIASEAQACLSRTDWEERIRRIENCLVVIKERMRQHSERIHSSELDKLVLKAKKGRDELSQNRS